MRESIITFILIAIYSLCSCSSKESKDILRKANTFSDTDPDSCLYFLESIKDPEELNPEDQAIFSLLKIKAKDKCYINLTNDTTNILKTLSHYKNTQNEEKIGWALYYAGRVYDDAERKKEAGTFFLEATEYAIKNTDNLLGTMSNYYIGYLYSDQFAHNEAINSYQTALGHSHKMVEEKYECILLDAIGSEYGIIGYTDSAFAYFKQAFSIAKTHSDTSSMINILNSMSVYSLENNLLSDAKEYLAASISLLPDTVLSPIKLISMADIYTKMNMPDSAFILLETIKYVTESSTNSELKATYFVSRSEMEKARKNYADALYYYKLYGECADSIYQNQLRSSLAEIKQKYDYTKTSEENSRLQHQKQNSIVLAFMIFICLLMVCYIAWIQLKRKKEALINAEETLQELKQKLEEKGIVDHHNYDEKNKIVNEVLLRQLEMATKVAVMHVQQPDKYISFLKKLNEIMYGEQRSFSLNWDELYALIDTLYNGFYQKIKQGFPHLQKKDIQLCCLLLIKLETNEIALCMEQSIHTVRKRKSEIRSKLSMPEGSDIIDFLLKNI